MSEKKPSALMPLASFSSLRSNSHTFSVPALPQSCLHLPSTPSVLLATLTSRFAPIESEAEVVEELGSSREKDTDGWRRERVEIECLNELSRVMRAEGVERGFRRTGHCEGGSDQLALQMQ